MDDFHSMSWGRAFLYLPVGIAVIVGLALAPVWVAPIVGGIILVGLLSGLLWS
jgi:hypothetical protein